MHHLLLVSSYLPEVGESLSTFGGEAPAPFLDIDPEGGTFTVRQDALAETFLQDCGPEIQQQATEKTARQSLAVLEAAGAVSRLAAGARTRTSSAPRTGARPPSASASSRRRPGRSSSSTPATTRSCPSRPPSVT